MSTMSLSTSHNLVICFIKPIKPVVLGTSFSGSAFYIMGTVQFLGQGIGGVMCPGGSWLTRYTSGDPSVNSGHNALPLDIMWHDACQWATQLLFSMFTVAICGRGIETRDIISLLCEVRYPTSFDPSVVVHPSSTSACAARPLLARQGSCTWTRSVRLGVVSRESDGAIQVKWCI